MLRMTVPGERSGTEQAKPPGAELLQRLGIKVTVEDAVDVAATRAVADRVELKAAAPDDPVEVTLEGRVRLYLPAAEAAELLAATEQRGPVEAGTVLLATALPLGDGTRGLAEWAVEGLRLIGIDLAGRTAAQVAKAIDERLVPEPGLYRWDGGDLAPLGGAVPDSKRPWLCFLHGTFSNTKGSFGSLAAQPALWRKLEAAYAGRILALEHRTLGASPIENAAALAPLLPEGVELHMVSHSRGGLVAELLCRGRLEGRDEPFDAAELGLFDTPDRAGQHAALMALGASLARTRPQVGRFVRVACPARGTVLASARLDRWLNFFLNALGLGAGAFASPVVGEIYDLVTAFLLAVIKERADPASVPGLEAMIPDTPLIKLLNRPGVTAATDLAVLEGDIEGAGILGRLKVLATDLFFREDHDLVVNTSAMNGGMARSPAARAFFDQGPEVSHFAYFGNPRTAGRVVSGLLRADDDDGGFATLPEPEPEQPAIGPRRGDSKRPIVFVVPGITGTELHWGDKRIWVDLPQLAVGGLGRLRIDAPDITAHEPLSLYYGALCRFLGRTHDVRPWGFDWRLSIADSAKLLGIALNAALAGTDQPVRIVAHSMGGLVSRCALQDAKLWQRFKERPGSRLIQLGTPNAGSWSIPFMLMGRNDLMGYLERLDFTMNAREQQAVVARFQGALQMLPHGEPTLFDRARWEAWAQLDPGQWAPPSAEDLAVAARFREQFASAPLDPERMLYVAGQAPTLIGVEEAPTAEAGQRIRFRVSPEGDGQVPWATGIPAGFRAWYTDAVHGDLARHEPAFPAILELLEQGTTHLLPDRAPAVGRGRGRGRGEPATRTRDLVPQFPDAEDLLLAGMGGARRSPLARAARRIRVSVVHGHLAFARHPVLVGHYAGDTIAGAERALDRALDGRLTERRQLGLYPGALGTSLVVLDRGRKPSGAVVVGLGDQADLAPGSLAGTLRRGVLAYAVDDRDAARTDKDAARHIRGLSALLVGSGDGGLPLPACVDALLRAVLDAQRALEADGLVELEILDLVESRAIRAWHQVARAVATSEFRKSFELDPSLRVTRGGSRSVGGEDDPTWWQPIQISMERLGTERVMRYVTTTGRARAEASLLPGNTGFVERFVAQATGSAAPTVRAPGVGRALFELLWPERIKETASEDRNLRLVLDSDTAAFPWELLDDRRPWIEAALGGDGERRGPAAVRAGLVRQLVQAQFRERPVASTGPRRALVVGDPTAEPQAGFQTLPGAVMEAEAVAAKLGAAGYEVALLTGDRVRPEQVIAALFEQAWTIIHIAAHGAVDFPVLGPDGAMRRQTGIVLGGGLFLGPAVLAQLPVVPSLVFVNCCHLGKIDPKAEAAALAQAGQRPLLAASVGVELIRIGVRGVVAAGWAVDDIAASRFAETFYDRMLGGDGFGMAALAARQLIYREGSPDQTWGAYQCYGEPDWRLLEDGRHGPAGSYQPPASLAEAVAAADEITESAQVGLDRDPRSLRHRLDRLNKARRGQAFETEPLLCIALARAYGELGSLRKAIRYYEAALASTSGELSLRAFEQLQNFQVRHTARALGPQSAEAEWHAGAATIEAAITKLDQLVALAGPSGERHNLLGGAYKRLAFARRGRGRIDALERMAKCYNDALALVRKRGGQAFYPELQVHAAEILLRLSAGKAGPANLPRRLRKLAEELRADAAADDFWTGTAVGDARLLAAISDGVISEAEEAAVVAAYLDPWRDGGSWIKLASVIEQLDFLAAILSEGPAGNRNEREALVAALRRMSEKLARAR